MSGGRSHHAEIVPYVTKDGTLIRELMHPQVHGNRRQSLAEAVLAPGQESRLHRHHNSEEVYHVTGGEGHMTLGHERSVVRAGDTVCIAPGMPHRLSNNGSEALHVLCCCAPPYAHDDTELL